MLTRNARHQHPPPSSDAADVGADVAAAALATTQAQIELDDAAAHRALQVRERELELDRMEQDAAEEAQQRAHDRKTARRVQRRADRKQRRDERAAARHARWIRRKIRFGELLSGRLVALLVALAMATAWYGQFGFFHAPTQPTEGEPAGLGLLLPFAAAGATALEVFGLAMFAIVREAGRHRDRALRARVLGWAVIAFSAWSNFTHHGPALAALSIMGPLGWEIHEWWRHRATLHTAGQLVPRPVRPRFPLDQVLLFPRWTLAAYRVAVRDRIESGDQALAVALAERTQRRHRRRLFSRRSRRRWAREVRAILATHARGLEIAPTNHHTGYHADQHADHHVDPAATPAQRPAEVPAELTEVEPSRPDTEPTGEPTDKPTGEGTGEASPEPTTPDPPAPTPDSSQAVPGRRTNTATPTKTERVRLAVDQALAAGTPLRDINATAIAKALGVSEQLGRREVADRRKAALTHTIKAAQDAGTIEELDVDGLARQVGLDPKQAHQIVGDLTGSTRRTPRTRALRRVGRDAA